MPGGVTAEDQRLAEDAQRVRNWKRWGPYLAERQWGTVREDYSASGTAWEYFPHDHARSRAYRWGEDGLLGICDRECRLAFALALWNERDAILKERLFGLSGPEGNHGEDVKEVYFYLEGTPTHSYLKALYRYPLTEFPYARLVQENARRERTEPELELTDTGVFDDGYVDVIAEYAKAGPDDILIEITLVNQGTAAASIHLLPTLWFRNTWSWGRSGEGYWPKPRIAADGARAVIADHVSLGRFRLAMDPSAPDAPWLFTENETDMERIFSAPSAGRYVKDAFHEYVVRGRTDAVDPGGAGTKAAAHVRWTLGAGERVSLRLRLFPDGDAVTPPEAFGAAFAEMMAARRAEADEFYAGRLPAEVDPEAGRVMRQAYAGLLWSKQFYHYVVRDWLEGDPAQPQPPAARRGGRNADWPQLYNRDVISMPDTWEYPWYAAWDLAFHMVPFAHLDPAFAKEQLILFLREWYMHANGQIPAYEWALSDVNPPVHAWAAWRVYKMTAPRGERDLLFLARVFQKLLLNFTWWVNRKDAEGNNLFAGGFLGLDNVGVFDRSKPLPTGGALEQADGTAWMAFYSATMLSMALELARHDPSYEDVASKFFEHFVAIVDAMNSLGGSGLWDEQDGFYYDQLRIDGRPEPLRLRSIAGLVPLFACEVLDDATIAALPGFRKRLDWFLKNRADLARHTAYVEPAGDAHGRRLLAVPSRQRLERVLRYVLDEREFLGPYGVRSLSRVYEGAPYVFHDAAGGTHEVAYQPAESTTGMFGGNSNWRGPVWFPLNYLLLEALERYHHFYGDTLRVECPVGSGTMCTLDEVAREIGGRLTRLFLPDASGRRPCHGDERRYAEDPAWRDLVLFYEYFHPETGRGLGASHQTGWTALVVRIFEALRGRG
ncbi:MAG TPA: glucosidase [Candidatus Binatia bacterium]|jgi:hypothetical protein